MKGYIARRRGRFYAVIYEGLDPSTGMGAAAAAQFAMSMILSSPRHAVADPQITPLTQNS
jgi:hypothetical protein